MKKRRLIKLVAVFSLLFLLIQFVLYKTVYRKSVDYLKKNFRVSEEEKLRLLLLFLETTARHEIPLVLLETSILTSVATNIASDLVTCAHLCQSSNTITFGIQASKAEKTELLDDYESDGFSIVTNYVRKSVHLPSESSTNKNLPSHHFLFQNGLVVHLVVLYTRGDNFIWSDKIVFDPALQPPWFYLSRASYGQHANVYDSFETRAIEIDKMPITVPKNILQFVTESKTTFLECNYSQTEHFYKKYPKDTTPQAIHFQKKGRQLLAKAKEILDSMNIKFWLSSGTCLGWYRQCGIIPYSKDVDIGIWIKDYKDGLTEMFEDRGFLLKHLFGRINDSFELSYRLGEVKLDIFFFYEENDHVWNGGTHAWTGQKYKYIFPKFNLCWTELLELKVRVPCETESYIKANYGQNWHIPVKDWQWNKSPPNIKENGMWPTNQWDTLIQVYD